MTQDRGRAEAGGEQARGVLELLQAPPTPA
jgi:hypothetical protein